MTTTVGPPGSGPAVTKPENCVMLVGIPTTERAFSDSIRQDANRFAGRFWSFRHYEADFLRPFRRFAFRARHRGLRIEASATLSDIRRWANLPDVHGLIVFSHADDVARVVELADGLASEEAVAATFPVSYSGFVDVSTCNSHGLAAKLRVRCRACSIAYRAQKTTPRVWLEFYDLVFRRLHREHLDYLGAMDRVAREWLSAVVELRRRNPERAGAVDEVGS